MMVASEDSVCKVDYSWNLSLEYQRDELTPFQRTGNVCEERGSKRCTEEFKSSRDINTNESVGCSGLSCGFSYSRHVGIDML